MTTLRRHFRKDGPNYAPSGLDTPGRDEERKELGYHWRNLSAAPLSEAESWRQNRQFWLQSRREAIVSQHFGVSVSTIAENIRDAIFGSEQGAGVMGVSPAPCSNRTEP